MGSRDQTLGTGANNHRLLTASPPLTHIPRLEQGRIPAQVDTPRTGKQSGLLEYRHWNLTRLLVETMAVNDFCSRIALPDFETVIHAPSYRLQHRELPDMRQGQDYAGQMDDCLR